jgi:hypothetical protein
MDQLLNKLRENSLQEGALNARMRQLDLEWRQCKVMADKFKGESEEILKTVVAIQSNVRTTATSDNTAEFVPYGASDRGGRHDRGSPGARPQVFHPVPRAELDPSAPLRVPVGEDKSGHASGVSTMAEGLAQDS